MSDFANLSTVLVMLEYAYACTIETPHSDESRDSAANLIAATYNLIENLDGASPIDPTCAEIIKTVLSADAAAKALDNGTLQ